MPAVPQTLEATGLSASLLEQLIFKILHFSGEKMGRDLAGQLGVRFSLIDPILEGLRKQRLIDVRNSLGYGSVSSVFTLSEAGRARARECMEDNQYADRAPVPLAQYVSAVREQRLKSGWLTKEALDLAYQHMVVSPQVLRQIGPAINSGKSFLIYGQPGNGKTFLAEALFKVDSSPIYVPYAIEYSGTIIKVFDPVYHQPIEDVSEESVMAVSSDQGHDRRWVLCKRPFIVTGGELTMDMLDLNYIEAAKIYEAPFQLKANNGIYLVDDFGRQRCTPAEVLNRWIVPMDRRVDFLSFNNGGKIEVPFETFLIFSTNLRPDQLGDEAFLRRIQYKMLMKSPEEEEFCEIYRRYCKQENLAFDPTLLDKFLLKHYRSTGKRYRRCHPRDVISHALDLIEFERLPRELSERVLDEAFDSVFVDSHGMDD